MLDLKSAIKNQIPRKHLIAFYLGIPLGLAYLFGLNYVGMARHFGLGLSLLYWAGVVVPFWWILDAASRVAALVLRPWKLPWWAILLVGSLLAIVLAAPYVQWHASLYASALPEGRQYTPPPSIWYVLGDWRRLMSFTGVPLVWISVNYFYDRIIDIPRYRGSVLDLRNGADIEPPPEPPSDFEKLIPGRLGTDIFALQAEDHYVRVFTDRGSGLVRFRFRDAVQQLAHTNGLQVHRSFWVARHAVDEVEQDGTRVTLTLRNGVKIPVSRAFREAARLAGVLEA